MVSRRCISSAIILDCYEVGIGGSSTYIENVNNSGRRSRCYCCFGLEPTAARRLYSDPTDSIFSSLIIGKARENTVPRERSSDISIIVGRMLNNLLGSSLRKNARESGNERKIPNASTSNTLALPECISICPSVIERMMLRQFIFLVERITKQFVDISCDKSRTAPVWNPVVHCVVK